MRPYKLVYKCLDCELHDTIDIPTYNSEHSVYTASKLSEYILAHEFAVCKECGGIIEGVNLRHSQEGIAEANHRNDGTWEDHITTLQ